MVKIADDRYIMWLTTVKSLSPKKAYDLLTDFEYAERIFKADINELRRAPYLTEANIKGILANRNEHDIERLERVVIKSNIRFITLRDPEYPCLLKEIYDPPVGLYILGELPDENLPKVSIIGSRKCSEYGLYVAEKISRQLAQHGVVVVSGMARGIDSLSHKGAIEGGGFTIAVLGTGVDICYPPENASLRNAIITHGCVMSEFPPGTPSSKYSFPQRNRIISGLSTGVLVVEAAESSGTSITVDFAIDQGREVMAVPGNITSRFSFGTNKLIAEGAASVSEVTDILDALGLESSEILENANVAKNIENCNVLLAREEKLVYDIMDFEPVGFDELANRIGLHAGALNTTLTMLEIKGLIKKLPGQRFIKIK